MKKILLIFILMISISGLSAQDTLISNKPAPFDPVEFKFPDYFTANHDNGMRIIYMEDHEQPLISFRLLIPGGSSLDKDLPGLADITADMMTKGAGELSADEFSNKIDFMGASFRVSSGSEYIEITGSSLLKYEDELFGLLKDVLASPKFPSDELKRIKNQMMSSLQYEKSQPHSLASKLTSLVMYGDGHPFANFANEQSIEKIENSDVKKFFKNTVIPSNAILAVTGDFKTSEMNEKMKSFFSFWKSEETPDLTIPEAKVKDYGIYFIPRPGSVQSIVYLAAKAPAYKTPDHEFLRLASGVLGGGFGSRLMRVLREEYAYTYSPKARLTNRRSFNHIYCYADVRNSVTDSSIWIMNGLITDLAKNYAKEAELNRIKKFMTGTYNMSFENPSYTASLLQNAEFTGYPVSALKNYTARLSRISHFELQRAAANYLTEPNLRIIVVGDPEVKDKLKALGNVYEYDVNIKPAEDKMAGITKIDMNANELLDKYAAATGGMENIKNIKSYSMVGDAMLIIPGKPEMRGQAEIKYLAPGMYYSALSLGSVKQNLWVKGDSATLKDTYETKQLTGAELNSYLVNIDPFFGIRFKNSEYKNKVQGKKEGNIILYSVSVSGEETYTYFDEKTFLPVKRESITDGPGGKLSTTINYNNYKEFNGVKIPLEIKESNQYYQINSKYNFVTDIEFDESDFVPPVE